MKRIFCTLGLLLIFSCNNATSTQIDANDDNATESREKEVSDKPLKESDIRKLLGDQKEWKLSGSGVELLGASCTEGELLVFGKDKVKQSTCVNGKWVPVTKSWTLHRESNAWKIKIDNRDYTLNFIKDTLVLSMLTAELTDPTIEKKYLTDN